MYKPLLTSGQMPTKASAWWKNSSLRDMTIVCKLVFFCRI